MRAAQLHARGRVFGAGTAQGSLAQRRQLCVKKKHESAAVEESPFCAIGLMRTVLAQNAKAARRDKLAVRH